MATSKTTHKRKKFIQNALGITPSNPQGAHPGALHQQLGIPQNQTIPPDRLQAAAKQSGKLGQRARFAMILKGLKH